MEKDEVDDFGIFFFKNFGQKKPHMHHSFQACRNSFLNERGIRHILMNTSFKFGYKIK
jgi:hypothetical protein